ncbi:MAG: TonB-dependent receptor [Chloracidobacterium sp.]|nr:TonB-dependent receptor [Chloracidobacterium sp.]
MVIITISLSAIKTNGSILTFTVFRLDIENAITKQALILPAGAVGKFLGSDVITSQNANGTVFVAASGNPVLVRANFTAAKIWGVEYELQARLTDRLNLKGNYTYVRASDKATGVPPNIEGGTPPATGFLGLRHNWAKFWVEGYATFASRQDRLSSGDLADRRTGRHARVHRSKTIFVAERVSTV